MTDAFNATIFYLYVIKKYFTPEQVFGINKLEANLNCKIQTKNVTLLLYMPYCGLTTQPAAKKAFLNELPS